MKTNESSTSRIQNRLDNSTGKASALPGYCVLFASIAMQSLMLPEAMAQQGAGEEIESIFVIGQRRAYQGDFDDLETPQADMRIDAETLRNAGVIDLDQALDLSASASRQNNFGGLWNSFAIRGFVGDENLPSNFLVNGFNAGRGFGGARDLSGIESVEVLKGPRAALYGRGEPGGTVNLVTKRPTFETAGEVVVSTGSWSTNRVDFDYTTPISDDVAIRLVGVYEDAESFRDTVESQKLMFSPSLSWRISDSSQLTYEMEYSNQETPFDRGVIAVAFGLDTIVQFAGSYDSVEDAIYTSARAVTLGIPAMDVESGELARTDGAYVDPIIAGALNVMRELNVIAGEPDLPPNPLFMSDRARVYSEHNGIWRADPLVQSGDYVSAGTRLGVITDYFGNELETITAPASGILLILFGTPPVNEGDNIVVIGRVPSQRDN